MTSFDDIEVVSDIDLKFDLFFNHITNILDQHVPFEIHRTFDQNLSWFTNKHKTKTIIIKHSKRKYIIKKFDPWLESLTQWNSVKNEILLAVNREHTLIKFNPNTTNETFVMRQTQTDPISLKNHNASNKYLTKTLLSSSLLQFDEITESDAMQSIFFT